MPEGSTCCGVDGEVGEDGFSEGSGGEGEVGEFEEGVVLQEERSRRGRSWVSLVGLEVRGSKAESDRRKKERERGRERTKI